MGCVSSKLVKKELIREIRVNHGGDHIVSLTSTTYGLLKLDDPVPQVQEPIKYVGLESDKPKISLASEEPEIINTWELMEDLEDSVPVSHPQRISPKSRGFFGKSWMSPMKSTEKMDSPKRSKRFVGKENKGTVGNGLISRGVSPNQVLKPRNAQETQKRGVLRLSFPVKSEEPSMATTQRRKSFSPLFDPDLVASYERELCQEQEQIKQVISTVPEILKPQRTREIERILKNFREICPPGGQNSVVIYTTTLRGIRKTFEDCNTVRSILESHQIQLSERDVSMHSGFKDEIRRITGTKQVKIPAVFMRGRLIGGVEEVVKLEEEGKLGILLEGLPAARLGGGGCHGCGGMRFVMCGLCHGSCKVMDKEEDENMPMKKKKKKMVKCMECNENGLIVCPFCP
ncbi:PREDICTED: uncharacterized protein At3g28850-like [Tarenaya hassleriana]|uniref:uncharacterized protein At3g28850-like n=1 Tax=Tarenaya hassleriana TaxID=28532 RepID=UPI00053C442E|nr:PREDICTED: uncharacterized protein At3g28850-like [Tarenaya hassleriana]